MYKISNVYTTPLKLVFLIAIQVTFSSSVLAKVYYVRAYAGMDIVLMRLTVVIKVDLALVLGVLKPPAPLDSME